MLIQFNEAKNALEKENKNLGEKMDEARRQIDAIESLSLKDQGLTGAAYRSLEERIHLRTSVLKAHYVAYQEIQAANGNNISALGRLKPSGEDGEGAVDPDACGRRIEEYQKRLSGIDAQIAKAQKEYRELSALLPRGEAQPLAFHLGQEWHFRPEREAIHALIEMNTEAMDLARSYIGYAEGIYREAKDRVARMLDASTTSVNSVLYSGRYEASDWMLEVDKGYEVSQIRRRLSTDGVVNKGEVERLFGKEFLTDVERRALAMLFVDLGEAARAGNNGQLNVFLNLGYRNDRGRRISYDQNLDSHAITYVVTREMKSGFCDFLLYCSNPKCASFERLEGSEKYQDTKNYLCAICTSCLQVRKFGVLATSRSGGLIDYGPVNSSIEASFGVEKKIGEDGEGEDINLLHIRYTRSGLASQYKDNRAMQDLSAITFDIAYEGDVAGNAADLTGYYAAHEALGVDPGKEAVYGALVSGFSSFVSVGELLGGGFYGFMYDAAKGGVEAYSSALETKDRYTELGALAQVGSSAQDHFITNGAIIHVHGLSNQEVPKTILIPDQDDYSKQCDIEASKEYQTYREECERSSEKADSLRDWLTDSVEVEINSDLLFPNDITGTLVKNTKEGKIYSIQRKDYISLKVKYNDLVEEHHESTD